MPNYLKLIFITLLVLIIQHSFLPFYINRETIPAIDLCILFYIIINKELSYEIICFYGLIIDTLTSPTLGITSLALLISYKLYKKYNLGLKIQSLAMIYLIFAMFACAYYILKVSLMMVTGSLLVGNLTILIHLLNTIFIYPTIHFILAKIIKNVE